MTANLDKPLPNLNAPESQPPASQNPISAVPKRKPVPVAKDAAPVQNATNDPGPHQPQLAKRSFLNWQAYSKKRKLFIIGAIIAIVCLIALIIGLAVGLTRKRNSNLPLPTSNGGPYEGDLTYYDPALGSCGITSSSSDMICAVSHILFDAASTGSNPNSNPLCGLKLRLRRDGKSVDVKVVDRCVGCKETDIDVSQSAFSKVADVDLGRVTVEWAWLESSPVSTL